MNPHRSNPPLSQTVRWTLAALAVGLVIVLAIGRLLEPDPRGYGTHERLGLAPCSFLVATGRPCPFCGATTAVSEATRGRIGRAWGANPAGAILGVLAAPLAAWLMASARAGRSLGFDSPLPPLAVALSLFVLVGSACWLMRFLDGPPYLAPAGAEPAPGPVPFAPEPRKEGGQG